MTGPPRMQLHREGGPGVLRLQGIWRMADLPEIASELAQLPLAAGEALTIDAHGLERIDTAAALLLLRRVGDAAHWVGLEGVAARIVERVRGQMQGLVPPLEARREPFLARTGRVTVALGVLLRGHLAFFGRTAAAFGALLRRPGQLRRRELVVQLERAGLDAIPVVALVSMLIGVVMAYLLGLQAGKYGANIFVVDGVAVGATREFAPIIVAVIVAGRSGASFAAQLGAMRLTEEVDAIRTLGLDVHQVLVVPRVLALVLTLPLLVFVGDLSSLVGAMLVTDWMLGIPPAAFLDRLHEALDLRHVLVGLVKAPVFAAVIALIGTRMGLSVARDARAVGLATTSTVVQGIVAVIVLDAAFAVVLQALGW
ncbi:MAG: ABC transporter permease [Betaproteobacteria bacterium]|nr:ABC transporter permease [Betaproteobacteria bacterium]